MNKGSDRAHHHHAERAAIAVAIAAAALGMTHAFWSVVHNSPFALAFGAAALSSRLRGRAAGFTTVAASVVGFVLFPPPMARDGFALGVIGLAIIASTFSYIVARRDEIESDLRTTQARLHNVLSSLPIVVWAIDAEGRIAFAEGRGLESLGLEADRLVGRSLFEVFRDNAEVVDNTRRALAGEAFDSAVSIGAADVQTWFSPLRDSQGRVIGASGVSMDVTERRRLERQYLHAQKMEAVGQLAAGIAHDFNNLLVVVGGYAELVAGTVDASDARRTELREIGKAADRAGILTQQLLGFSRRQMLRPRVVDVNQLVASMHKLLRRTIGEHIHVELSLEPAVERVRIDPAAFEQVLLNLALNARDAMPHGGRLRFQTDLADVDETTADRQSAIAPGRYVRVTVSDTGTGIPPELEARIFDPFFTTKAHGQGSGLGLAMVQGVVSQSGGFIRATSELGRGTTFTIHLPAVQQPADDVEARDESAPTAGGTETVLVAEDDSAVRRLTANVLRRWGYRVIEAGDADEAMALAQSHAGPIDLLVTDVVMPGGDGISLAARLIEHRPRIRVLYMSGYANQAAVRQGNESGASFLPKPFLPANLLSAVRDVLASPADVVL